MPRLIEIFAAASLILTLPAQAQDIRLGLPIDCTLGETCHIQHFVDRDPGPGIRDYRCGDAANDGHKGTDFALATLAEMRAGVDVLASAPGVVRGMRDGMPDTGYNDATQAGVEGRECGNGVVLRHEGGYETQYCHLKSGSVRVREGDRVERGAVLGQVGLSGMSQFPHVHLSVRKDNAVVDPFDTGMGTVCGGEGPGLWDTVPDYQAAGLLDIGFAAGIPGYDAIRDGSAAQALAADSPALVLFGFAWGGRMGDVMRIEIDGPEGRMLDERIRLDKDQARFFRAAGKRLTASAWPKGRYKGSVTMLRDGAAIDSRTLEMVID